MRVSFVSPLWEGGLGTHIVPLPVTLYFRHAGLLQLFKSSKDPPVFSSKEPFDVLNDKARHHGSCLETGPSRYPGGAAARLKCFVSAPSRWLCSQSCLAWLLLGFLGKMQSHWAILAQLCMCGERAQVCPSKWEPCFVQGYPGSLSPWQSPLHHLGSSAIRSPDTEEVGLLQPGPLQNLVLIPVFRKASAPHLWNGDDNDNSDPRRLNDTTHTLAEALAHAGSQ